MTHLCVTRAIKNARHLQTNAPQILPMTEPPEGYGSRVPRELLARLHTPVAPADLDRVPGLAAALARAPIPRPKPAAAAPLFNGYLVFAAVTFRTSAGAVAVPAADLAVALDSSRVAVMPIVDYAPQYGPNRVTVGAQAVPFAASTPSGRYNDQILQGWVNSIVASNRLPTSTCVVVLNPQGVVNTDADPSQGIGGYHGFANVPFCFVILMGTGLTGKDEANFYALALSHEFAELDVDPRADLANPECCDGCGPNCQRVWIDYFNNAGGYIQTLQAFPPPFDYAFFINAIAEPASATMCPAPGAACDYAPP